MQNLRAFARNYQANFLVTFAGLGLLSGTLSWWFGYAVQAECIWSLAILPVLLSLLIQIAVSLTKGDVGLDIVAALSMTAALAFGEPLAGNVVALMYAGGQMLENFAQGRARREMSALLGRVAHSAMRYRDQTLEEVPIASIIPADRLLIRQGEVVPVDGRVATGVAILDLSALTGESVPQRILLGSEVLSGSTSAGPAFDMVAIRPAAQSTYAGIVRMVEAAQASKAPMVRMADRYAMGFLLLTIIIALATWFMTQNTIRVLAVLVAATPCPLILAVPVALISGMSRAAGMGVLVKGGAVLEMLARVRTVILDKTGTLTHGLAEVTEIRLAGNLKEGELLRLAASLDQASAHVAATALIREASRRGIDLAAPHMVMELPGTGIEGLVDGRNVVVGGSSFVQEHCGGVDPRSLLAGIAPEVMTVAVGVNGIVAGVIVLTDKIRADAKTVLCDMRNAGIARIVLASGDRTEIARAVGTALGVDLVLGELSPDAKVNAVRNEAANGPVMMVGDGVNDAPALAAADIGVAMGAHGTASSSEVAGVVLLVDELAPLVKAMKVARRSKRIALQSVVGGLGLSMAAMTAAAFGYLPPVQSALLQEAIDIAVILNALRALR